MGSLEDPSETIVLTFWESKRIWMSSIRKITIFYLIWWKNSNPLLK
ncbi:MAG: hypothetical protein AB7V56_13260 [Candidatus Nitrosocosmicus sp.]